jgi:hypothetical protein
MKKYLGFIIAIFFLSMFPKSNFAQKKSYVPEQGFWQLVSNVHEKKNTLVQFYDDSSNLIYEERITGVRMNIKRNKTLLHLKAALEKAMIAWNKTKETKYNNGLLADIIKDR